MNMPESITIFDFVVLLITLFLGYQIYRALGMRTGTEKKRHGFSPREVTPQEDDSRRDESTATAQVDLAKIDDLKLEKIIKADSSFGLDKFLEGAKNAFEIILKGFVTGDKAVLKPLLSLKMYNQFSALIDQREKNNQSANLSFFRLVDAEVVEADYQRKTARIGVQITSEQTLLVKEGDKLVDGDPDYIDTVVDVWVFERKIESRSPLWILKEITDKAED